MGSIGFGEIAFLVVLGLLIFGPEKLPGIANSVGKAIGTLKREASGTLDELKKAAEADDLREITNELRATSNELRGAGQSMRGSFAGLAGAAAPAVPPVSAADDGPPPFDPDAT